MEIDNKLKEAKANSRNRIIELIQEFCEGSQQQFVDKTGLTKGAVSQYVNGHRTPSNLAAQKIGEIFNVAPAWVMGFDVPKKEYAKAKADFKVQIEGSEHIIELLENQDETYRVSPELFELFGIAQKCTPEQIKLAIQIMENFVNENK